MHRSQQQQQPLSGSVAPRPIRGICAVIKGFLYIGSETDANDAAAVQELQIQHLLCCAADIPSPQWISDDVASAPTYVKVSLNDTVEDRLENVTGIAFAAIEFARARGERILVYCKMGISRSASVIIAYLIEHRAHTFQSALKFIRTVRPQVDPNTTLSMQLALQKRRRKSRGNHSNITGNSSNDGTSTSGSNTSSAASATLLSPGQCLVQSGVGRNSLIDSFENAVGEEDVSHQGGHYSAEGTDAHARPPNLGLLAQGFCFASVDEDSLAVSGSDRGGGLNPLSPGDGALLNDSFATPPIRGGGSSSLLSVRRHSHMFLSTGAQQIRRSRSSSLWTASDDPSPQRGVVIYTNSLQGSASASHADAAVGAATPSPPVHVWRFEQLSPLQSPNDDLTNPTTVSTGMLSSSPSSFFQWTATDAALLSPDLNAAPILPAPQHRNHHNHTLPPMRALPSFSSSSLETEEEEDHQQGNA